MKTYVRAVVKDKNGKVIKDTGWKETNTLTRNFYAFLSAAMRDEPTPCTRVDGTDGEIYEPSYSGYEFMHASVAAEHDERGLVVGTGTTEPTRNDYKLESQIPHGTGAGQLYYRACDVVFGDDYIEVMRAFENQSSDDITINEVGIIVIYRDKLTGDYEWALIARSLFTLTIPAGGSATLYYKISG